MKLTTTGLVMEAFGAEWEFRWPTPVELQAIEESLRGDDYSLARAGSNMRALITGGGPFARAEDAPDAMIAMLAPRFVAGVWGLCEAGKPSADASGTTSEPPMRNAEAS